MVKNPSAMRETWVQSLGQEDPLEEEMANPLQYSCLENPRTEEPGELQPMGPQRVGHDYQAHMTYARYAVRDSVCFFFFNSFLPPQLSL